MNIAIIGKSKLNKLVRDRFAQEGFDTVCVEDAGSVRALLGEPGNFTLKTSSGEVKSDWVVITDSPKACPQNSQVADLPVISLTEERDAKEYRDRGMPIVFLLDDPQESPAYLTRIALEKAALLARKKKQVIYLTRFVRTAEPGLETLYLRARNAGVVFVKYDAVDLYFNEDDDLFTLQVDSGYESTEVHTYALVVAKEGAPQSNPALNKALRLKNYIGGVSNRDQYYLFPTLTGRKGVLSLGGAEEEFGEDELDFAIRQIVSTLKTEQLMPGKTQYAVVDPAKCAYCYTCYRACSHGAMEPDPESSAMRCLPKSCDGCGVCVSVCPAAAIKLKNAPEFVENAGRLKVFCCENSGEIALKRLMLRPELADMQLSVTPMPCGGRLSAQLLLTALNEHDAVLVLVCSDDACRHADGNRRAMQQVERAKALLRAVGLDENRVHALQLSHAMPDALYETLSQIV